MRPRIGVTSGTGRNWLAGAGYWKTYADAVEEAGGEPVFLGREALDHTREALRDLQGVLFTGGKDVDLRLYPNPPDLHGEDPEAVMERFRMEPEADRDEYELPLLHEALDRVVPILGICRGCQLMGVGLGGRLVLDIELETHTAIRHAADAEQSAEHGLRVLPGTHLAGILPPERYTLCNSRHHQAVRIDDALTARVCAVSPDDGIVEAIEVPGHPWAIGVQWHPERAADMEIRELYRPLFEAFVAAAR